MKPIDINPIIKAIEARQDNAEDLPPLTTGDFLRMLREAAELRQLKPHGDLIDREVLKAHIDSECVRGRIFTGITIAEAMKQIADEVPVIIEGSEANV